MENLNKNTFKNNTVDENQQINNFEKLRETNLNQEYINMQTEQKQCNCKQSRCLKLYCECFQNGQYCNGCNCVDCLNNNNYEECRELAIQNTLERNPQAFQPKIPSNMQELNHHLELSRKQSKGCACRKSGCLKKYCECYQANMQCTQFCKCVQCQNMSDGCCKSQEDSQQLFLCKNQLQQLLEKLLLAKNEQHFLQIINEKLTNLDIEQMQELTLLQQDNFNLTDQIIKETYVKMNNIINQSLKEFVEDQQNQAFIQQKLSSISKEQLQTSHSKESTMINTQDELFILNDNQDMNDLMCDEEQMIDESNKQNIIEKDLFTDQTKQIEQNTDNKISLFDLKKDLILSEFIQILQMIDNEMINIKQ